MHIPLERDTKKQRLFSEQIYLSDYLNIIKKRKRVVMIFSLVFIGLVSTFSFLSTPLYKATTQIIIERQLYPVTNAEEAVNRDMGEQDFYQTQYNLLQSRSLALKVIQDLELWKDFPTGKPATAPQENRVSETAQAGQALGLQSQRPFQQSSGLRNIDALSAWSDIIDWYLDSLRIEPVRGSRLINISFLSPSPETAAHIANAHAHAFIERNTLTKISASQQGVNWLKVQLNEQKKKLEASQRAVQEYKRSHGIVSFDDRQNIVTQQLMDLNASLMKATSERVAKQTLYNQLKSFSLEKENIFSLPEVAQDSVILSLRNQLIQLRSKRLEMSANFGPKHPKMIDINSQITQLEQEITREVRQLRSMIEAELDRAIAHEKTIQQNLNALKSSAISLNEKAVNYDVLKQEAQSNQQIYDTLLKQATEMGMNSEFENSNVSIVDESGIPQVPERPKRFFNILMSIVVSMFVGPFLALFIDYMDRTIKAPGDIQRRLGIMPFGTVPFFKSAKKNNNPFIFDGIAYKGKKKETQCFSGNGFNLFVPALHMIQQEIHGQVIFFESAVSGEGKTSVVANSAIHMAKKGLRVLVVDADTDHPSLHSIFDLENEKGLLTVMTGVLSQEVNQGTLNEYSIDDLFFIISLKKFSGNLTVKNDSQSMNAFFEKGRLLYLECQGGPVIDRLGTILVRNGSLSENQLKEALESNRNTGKPLGYILVNGGYLTRESLQGALKLQMEERLQRLFSWRQANFIFESMSLRYEDERIHFGEDFSPIIRLLGRMESSRFIKGELFSKIVASQVQNISFLPSGSLSLIPDDFTYRMLFAKFLDILKAHFDIIIVDVPPLVNIPDAAPLSTLGDGVFFVVKAGNLSDRTLQMALTRLKEAGVNILGVILNQSKMDTEYLYKLT